MFEFEVTRGVSGLIEATGYWSGNEVFFNQEPNRVVIIDQELCVADFQTLIKKYLQKHLETDTIRRLSERQKKTKKTLIEVLKSNGKNGIYAISRSEVFDRKYLKHRGVVSWVGVANWLSDTFKTEEEQMHALTRLLTNAIMSDHEIIKYDMRASGVHTLQHPWLMATLETWREANIPADEVVLLLSELALNSCVTIPKGWSIDEFHEKSNDTIQSLREKKAFIPELTTRNDLDKFGNLSHASAILLGLLRLDKKIILPGNIEAFRLMSLHQRNGLFDIPAPPTKYALNKTFIYRLLAASTMNSLADTPENIGDIVTFIPLDNLLNSSMSLMLKQYADEHALKLFPLNNLNRAKARRNKSAPSYTSDWAKDQGLPAAWVRFVKTIELASDAGQQQIRSLARGALDWGCIERGFETPADILVTDLRDPHQPDRNDTLHRFISRMEISRKWAKWNSVERSFFIVHQRGLIENETPPLLTKNPFTNVQNPFRDNKPRTTHRRRIPTNQHEAMVQVLLSPDENGNPTFSFVRDILQWDWFDWINPSNGKVEHTWCPSRAHCLAFLFLMPTRSKQARWLDQGLMDEKIWDVYEQRYMPNTHSLKDWRHPITGKSHMEMYGRPSGALQPIHDDWLGEDQLCIFVNTNKTEMWNPERTTGYEIWWPRGDQLRDCDIASLSQQVAYLDRPYLTLENQIQWLQQHDSNPVPITFSDSSADAASVNHKLKDHYPYFTPLFRDITSPYYRSDGTEYYLPVTRNKLGRLYSALALAAEKKLRDQGADVILTVPAEGHNNAIYKGRRARYDMHSLRVYGVSYLMEIGVPWSIVQMIVGHMTPAMTIHYNKPTSEFVRSLLAGKLAGGDILSDWDTVADDVLKNQRHFIAINTAFGNDVPSDLLDEEYIGFTQKPGGMCPLGGSACDFGQVSEVKALNGKNITTYIPVNGGCGNCRFFCTTPAHLLQHQMVINDLFIRIRSIGKQQASLAEQLSELNWQDNKDSKVAQEKSEISSRIEEVERQIEPMIREWMNRTEMATKMIEYLDDFILFIKDRKSDTGAMLLLSASSAEDLEPHIEMRMEKTGEFELARQTLLAAHLQGGIDQCSELSRSQVREFMDRIMIHDDPKLLLLQIFDEKTRNKVAFLMSEAMAAIAGPQNVQKALDENKGLMDIGLSEDQLQDLRIWTKVVFNNAKRLGSKATIDSLLPPSLHLIEGNKDASYES